MSKPRSKLKGCLFSLAVVVGVLGLILLVGRASFRRVGNRQLAAVVDKLDTEDPGWRFEAIEEARAKAAPPDAVNPARVVIEVQTPLEKTGWSQHLNDAGIGAAWNTHPGFWETVSLAKAVTAAGAVPAAAREALFRPAVFNQPAGQFRVEHQDNPFATLLPEIQKAREVFAVLDADGRMAALGGDPDRAVADARAILVATRAVGDEPFLISQLVRMAGASVACRSALQTLAWGEPNEGLDKLQAELLAEAAHPGYLFALRGERAMMDRMFDGLESGKLGAKDLTYLDVQQRVPEALQEAGLRLYRGFLPGDRAECLRVFTDFIAAAQLPIHEQKAAIAAVKLPPRPPESYRYLVSNLVLPAVDRVHAAHLRTRTDLRTAAVAVACERFRRKAGRWPEKLEEIPKDILPELPTDPGTGGPLGYERTDDGVIVFGVETDDRRTPNPRNDDPLQGRGRGWRLWDPKARGKTLPAPDSEFIPEPPAQEAPGGGDGP